MALRFRINPHNREVVADLFPQAVFGPPRRTVNGGCSDPACCVQLGSGSLAIGVDPGPGISGVTLRRALLRLGRVEPAGSRDRAYLAKHGFSQAAAMGHLFITTECRKMHRANLRDFCVEAAARGATPRAISDALTFSLLHPTLLVSPATVRRLIREGRAFPEITP